MLVANTHTQLLLFSSEGKVYWRKVYEIPLASRTARGRPIINMLPLGEGERITAMLPVAGYDADQYVLFATARGTVKKTLLTAYSRPLSSGIRAINLAEGDELIAVSLCGPGQEVMLFSDGGKVARFPESLVRAAGRIATGVRGIRLKEGQRVVSLIVPQPDWPILTATANGFGKRTDLAEYPAKGRANMGVVSIKVTERNGPVIGAVQTDPDSDIILISDKGTLVRTRTAEVSMTGRNTQGVRLIRMGADERLVGLSPTQDPESDEQDPDTDEPGLSGDEPAVAGDAPDPATPAPEDHGQDGDSDGEAPPESDPAAS